MALEQPLIALPTQTIQNNDCTADDLTRNHQQFIDNGHSVDIDNLVEILGGPDAILQHYLSSNNLSPLTSHQLNQINNLITNNDNDDNKDESNSASLRVSAENTLFHQLLSKTTANKIISIIYSKPMVIAVSLTIVFWPLLAVLSTSESIRTYTMWIWFVMLFAIISYLLLSILTVNVIILKRILQTFIFWFKTFYGIKCIVCISIVLFKKYWLSPANILGTVWTLLLIVWYALTDGIHMPLRAKMIIGIILSIYFLYVSFYYTFVFNQQCLITINWWNYYSSTFDISEWTASAVRVVTIFIWKQTAYSIWKPSQSTLIKRSVQITWE